ncbi:dihydrofolate reductase family protein [Clostridioides difficile]
MDCKKSLGEGGQSMNNLEFFNIPKNNLKINILNRNEKILDSIKKESNENVCIPDALEYYTELFFPKSKGKRPYIFSSMVLSSDGKMAYEDNKAGPLIGKNNFVDPDGALADFWVLNVLRAYSDAVIIGARTLQNEPGITCHVFDESLTQQRKDYLNKKYQPCGVVVSFDATDIPFDHYTFRVDKSQEYKMVIATSPNGWDYIKENSPLKHICIGRFNSIKDVDDCKFEELYKDFDVCPVIVTGKDSTPDSKVLLYVLKRLGIEKMCIESPSYCTHLIENELLDEYFMNYSMVFVGGKMTPGCTTAYSHLEHPHSELLTVGMHRNNFIFTRQKLCYGIKNQVDLTSYKY